jgi:hypothetical protein
MISLQVSVLIVKKLKLVNSLIVAKIIAQILLLIRVLIADRICAGKIVRKVCIFQINLLVFVSLSIKHLAICLTAL